MKNFYVYILKCKDGSFYTGMTSNLDQRLNEHNSGKYSDCYTFKRLPLELIYAQFFPDFNQAMMWEKKIKGWSQKKKIALIEERWEDLQKYSKNYTQYGKPNDSSTGSE